MQDRDFLGYFSQLGSPSTTDIKHAAGSIVATLVASSTTTAKRRASSVDENDPKQKNLAKLQKKYLTGDLGEGMSADLNYTLKRVVNGLLSDNHTVKRGYFLAASSVLARFKKQIDPVKLLAFIREEAKLSKTMKNPEVHALVIGHMMNLTAMVEAQVFQQGATLNNECIAQIVGDLIHLYKTYEYTRESIQQVLVKLLQRVGSSAVGGKLLERISGELIADYKQFALKHADNLSLVLALQAVFRERFEGHLEKDHIFRHEYVTEKNLGKIGKLLNAGTYLYPRLHSSI